ncbi:hypothetical protein Gasu_61000 isoform 2 [Galdieria sulphuraria]|uniref:Uncharacterized protein n=1 Tax=Galdieria sulphuraria TaxID=130081 RepID=M2X8V6_GALSU|nr:hypothetical protein Gasu_61000 isoform 2 [Galdieria sulphuraria]EME26257.1 hypothetical protein isoform 2 [Galdieria sulphuraria]|eukprot:XP_005702777.1 hypothetical protein isoform 2 [Galdieria sulphuraria]
MTTFGSSFGNPGTSSLASAAGVTAGIHNPNNDKLVNQSPNDTVSSIAFSPKALAPNNFIVAGSWDNEVRLWQIQASGDTSPIGMIQHEAPVLDVAWSADGMTIFSVGCERTGKMWNPATNQVQPIAQHDAPIRCVRFASDLGTGSPAVVTGSWDKTLKYWDPRASTNTPLGTVTLPERVYAMDVLGPVLVVATANRRTLVYDIRNPTTPYRDKESPMRYQSRCVAIFTDMTGFALGSIEGRVGIEYIQEADQKLSFAYKCHRDRNNRIFAVNAISFHPVFGTFSTAGSDGYFNFWDKDSKMRLHQFQQVNQPITCTAFNHDGKNVIETKITKANMFETRHNIRLCSRLRLEPRSRE